MAINRIRIGKQAELSIAPNSIVRTDINNEQEYVSPLSDNYPNRIDNIVATTTYDALNPLVGWVPPSNPILDNVTQVKFTDGTIANYTWDGSVWVQDFINEWFEKRICLNTAAVAFTPADLNNPLVSEVDAWAIANLTIQQRENGTILTYFVPGDGGSCDVPDYEWTLNKGSQLVTLSNKRVFNTKTVYVDAGSGSDVTGRRGYREFPFKTIDAAIAVTQIGDLLKVFPGTYTQTTTIQNLINIDCEEGVTWTFTSNFFNNTPDWATDITTTWSFDILKSTLTAPAPNQHNFGIKNSLGIFILNANLLEYVYHAANVAIKQRSINVKKLVNSYMIASSLTTTDAVTNINLDYYERTAQNNNALLLGAQMANGSKLTTHVKNLKSINSVTGYGITPTIGYYFGSDAGINKQYTTIIDNVTHDDPNIYTTPPGVFASLVNYNANTATGYLFALESIRNGSNHYLEIKNLKANGNVVKIRCTASTGNAFIHIKLSGVITKGLPISFDQLNNMTNSTILIELDIVSDVMAITTGQGTGGVNIHPSNSVIITGKIKTLQAAYPCISIGDNTNGTILLKDLSLINDGTVSPIMTNQVSPQNVQIQNVVTNSLISDPNILEVGQSIIRNTNYK